MTESYLPQVNGVTTSVLRVSEELKRRGHRVLIIAPGRVRRRHQPAEASIVRTRAVALPWYREVKVGLADSVVPDAIRSFQPDILHLASPVALGAAALRTARDENIPAVAVYQTDLPRYATSYHLPLGRPAAWRWLRRVHNRADLTLAPTRPVASELLHRGFRRVKVWGRGVDVERFHPRHRSVSFRSELAPDGELILGYVGRLSRDKEVAHLAHVYGHPGTRLVVVGDGPLRSKLERRLVGATFTGFLEGDELSRAYASLDALVHTCRFETFGQVIQESLASGTPVLAPTRGGPLDLVHNARNGLFWPAEDPGRMKLLVSSLVADRELVAALRHAARTSVVTNTWGHLVNELEDHYRAVSYHSLARVA